MTIPARLAAALADRYRLERELGRGGMATVYLAEDLKHGRKVALKVLHPHMAAALGSARFLKEIHTTAQLQHPQILPLFDSGDADGLLYYVMPFVDGETLRQRMDREKPLPIADALHIISDIAGALEYAHERGIVHRDIKPENILVQHGQTMVADFGIALVAETSAGRLTETGTALGTPTYMSPEQATGDRVIDSRSDVYAMGAMLYEMLTGTPPFTGSSAHAIAAKVITEKAAPPSSHRKDIPPYVEAVIQKAMQKNPDDRFPTAAAFQAALANPTLVTTPRNRRWLWSGAALVGVLVLAVVWLALPGSRTQPTRHRTTVHAPPDTAARRLVVEAAEYAKRRDPEACKRAINLYSHATEKDTMYAEAWAGLARANVLCALFGPGDPTPSFTASKSAAETALRLNDTLSGAYTARAMFHLFHEQDWAAAQRDFAQAIRYDSTQYEPWLFRTWAYIAVDSIPEAVRSMRRAKELAPVEAIVGVRLATTLRYSNDVAGADSELAQVLAREPSNALALGERYELNVFTNHCDAAAGYQRAMLESPVLFNRGIGAYGLAKCGHPAEAQRFADSLAKASESGYYVDQIMMAVTYAGLGDSTHMYRALDHAVTQHTWSLFYIGIHYAFVEYHGHAAFEAFKQRAGLQ